MDIKGLVVYATLVFLVNAEDNIYTLKHICPPQLYATLRKHNCVYYQPSISSTPSSRNIGPIPECCRNKCSEYYLVTSYCKRSTIDFSDFVTERTSNLNKIVKEESSNKIEQSKEDDEVAGGKVSTNMLMKETPQVRKIEISKQHNDRKLINNPKKIENRKLKNQRRIKIKENCICTCNRRKRKEEKTYKPPVIVLSKISPNPPIPIQRRYTGT